MAVQKFSAQWSPQLPLVGSRFQKMGVALVRAVQKGLRQNARLMAAELKETTPRSAGNVVDDFLAQSGIGNQDHVADGWTTREREAGIGDLGGTTVPNDIVIEVLNANPRFDKPLQAGSGQTSLGLILEFGSAPHKITPKKPGGTLVFFWPAVGELVKAKSVEHPGTRPYGMMAHATGEALHRADRLLTAMRRVIEDFNLGFGDL